MNPQVSLKFQNLSQNIVAAHINLILQRRKFVKSAGAPVQPRAGVPYVGTNFQNKLIWIITQ